VGLEGFNGRALLAALNLPGDVLVCAGKLTCGTPARLFGFVPVLDRFVPEEYRKSTERVPKDAGLTGRAVISVSPCPD
jgi:hypothetical protein